MCWSWALENVSKIYVQQHLNCGQPRCIGWWSERIVAWMMLAVWITVLFSNKNLLMVLHLLVEWCTWVTRRWLIPWLCRVLNFCLRLLQRSSIGGGLSSCSSYLANSDRSDSLPKTFSFKSTCKQLKRCTEKAEEKYQLLCSNLRVTCIGFVTLVCCKHY